MAEEPEKKGAFYRGVKLDYAWVEDYWFATLEGEALRADTIPELHALIDAILGPVPEAPPEDEEPEVPAPVLTRVEVYLGCSVYLWPDGVTHSTP
ncbi:unnamed protein product, partial [marine sediment metagenome]